MRNRQSMARYAALPTILVLGVALGYAISIATGLAPSYIPLVSAFVGLLVAFMSPLWQALTLNAPKLNVEINAIKRKVCETALVQIKDDTDLQYLIPPDEDSDEESWISRSARTSSKSGVTLPQLEELLAKVKQDFRELPARIEELRRTRDKLSDKIATSPTSAIPKYEFDRMNVLRPFVEYEGEPGPVHFYALQKKYEELIKVKERRRKALEAHLSNAEGRVEVIKNNLINSQSYFQVSASLFNSGRSSAAIKAPALLRISIGEGNYVDLRLSLKDYESKSDIPANGTRTVIFESSEISALPEEDRKLINSHWGQPVTAKLYLEDIREKIHSSNTIAFAEGVYQKMIYDRLAVAAGAEPKRTVRRR